MRKSLPLLVTLGVAALTGPVVIGTGAAAATAPTPRVLQRSVDVAAATAARTGATRTTDSARYLPSSVECTAGPASGAGVNLKLDCDSVLPNNEPDVNVDPANPRHLVASSNDYDSNGDEFYTSVNGGRTWTTGDMSLESSARIGSDPVTTFDVRHHTVIHTSLNFLITEQGEAKDGDLVVSLSTDGGISWGKPVVVADGVGQDSSPLNIFNDKQWMVTDNNPRSPYYGRTYLTWTAFFARNGNYTKSPIFSAHSDDGGRSWTTPQEISGASSACTLQVSGPRGRCDENQFSVPTIGRDGTLYVAFENGNVGRIQERGETAGGADDAYLVVKSTNGGRTFGAPVMAAGLEDGRRDYPTNVSGRQTLTGFQLRVNSAGNIVANPKTGQLAIVFSDNRAGLHDVARPTTNTNVYMVTSYDGVHWTGATPVATGAGDQWFPWVDANPVTGQFGVLYNNQRGTGTYDVRLATGRPGTFREDRVSTANSLANDSAFFQAGAPGCEKCTVFNGDYIRVAYGSDGKANMVWTDMRRTVRLGDTTGHGEFIVFARQ